MFNRKEAQEESRLEVSRRASCLKVAQYACASVCVWASTNLSIASIQSRLLNLRDDNLVEIHPFGIHFEYTAFEKATLLTLMLSGIAAIEIKRVRDRGDEGSAESRCAQSSEEVIKQPKFDPQKCLEPYFDIREE